MCNKVFEKNRFTNADPERNHICSHLNKQAEGRESFQPSSQNIEDRLTAYRDHYIWRKKENKEKVYSDPSTEADLKYIYSAE